MSVLEALVLGIVQGLTEFLPISSSGHLVVVPALLGWQDPDVAFIVLLHAATLLALLIYFARTFLSAITGLARGRLSQVRFFLLVAVGTFPAALAGVLLEKQFEEAFGHEVAVAWQITVTGVILIVTEMVARKNPTQAPTEELDELESVVKDVSLPTALMMGIGQAVSIIPGISRSGTTIAAGLMAGLSREQAARFSFLLSAPILAGTTIFQIPDMSGLTVGAVPMVVGFLASGITGYLAIAGMIGYLKRHGMLPFALYCLVVGTATALILSR